MKMRIIFIIIATLVASSVSAGELRIEDRHGRTQATIEQPSQTDRFVIKDGNRVTHDVRRVSPNRYIVKDRSSGRVVGNVRTR
jgi:hypothetical protein